MHTDETMGNEVIAPQSTRLLQELLTFRAKVDLLEAEIKNLQSDNERLRQELASAHQKMLEDEESTTKAFGLLGHELELARAMVAHLKKN